MYSTDMTWAQWSQQAENTHGVLNNALDQGLLIAKKWADFSFGLTDAQIGAALGKSAADAANMRLAYGAFKSAYDLLHGNVAQATPFDFTGYWAKF
jgi:hypothetical protein